MKFTPKLDIKTRKLRINVKLEASTSRTSSESSDAVKKGENRIKKNKSP
jgi:hypothetical protein